VDETVDASALELWTVAEVAKKLRLSEATVWRRIYSGDLESVRDGRSRRIAPAAVAEYIARLRATAQQAQASPAPPGQDAA
jgi:excisionase family DNA binding protein